MPVKRIVNTSPLVFLVRADLLEILRAETPEIVVPEPVIVELYGHGADDPTVEAVRRVDWLRGEWGQAPGRRVERRGTMPEWAGSLSPFSGQGRGPRGKRPGRT